MNYKNLKINEKELSKIKMAEEEIKAICEKYNVYLQGSYEIADSEYGCSCTYHTRDFSINSKDYENRVTESDISYELQFMYKKQESLRRFLEKHKREYPNHLNLTVYKKEFVEPSGWKHDTLFVEGLRVKDWDKVKEPLFWWNPNKFWQYNKRFKNDEIRADVSMSIYPKIETPTFYSHQGNINCELYEKYENKTDVLSHSFLIQMVDELLVLGILEIV
jgi:hypothetical protein